MNSRERIRALIAREPADRCGFWLGNPHPDTFPLYFRHFHTDNEESLRRLLGDDYRWIRPEQFPSFYRHPRGEMPFHEFMQKKSHGQAGPLANCTSVDQLDEYEWPSVDYVHLDDYIAALHHAGDFYRAGGFWTPFYHHLMDLFGMEAYLVKMYECPEVVLGATDRVCQFYYDANRMVFERTAGLLDGFFFGNDFGTQLDLIMSPALFDRFVMPWFQRFTDLAHSYGLQVILHSCGSIYKVIDRLISAGVDCLHPLQALAANMNAEKLAESFGGRITFLGGIDTQNLLVNATPKEVAADVERVIACLGPHLIVSPSHEALLPNVSAENVLSMARAATGSQG
ncbi:MAG TPA: uroporphyrinogen decarboxylase family protein [bacterium]|nr:uroporphyrinogen decarboxylase family protein [bacterium]HOX86107.1 uroporphyrinogen decarboxylase family protein [bacterium]HPG45679.1 uroporphyrinogen decarboxylase family protein [bacterium]HPM97542.1 uroporphyrinogen decarboxylase family protein [bacterium]